MPLCRCAAQVISATLAILQNAACLAPAGDVMRVVKLRDGSSTPALVHARQLGQGHADRSEEEELAGSSLQFPWRLSVSRSEGPADGDRYRGAMSDGQLLVEAGSALGMVLHNVPAAVRLHVR